MTGRSSTERILDAYLAPEEDRLPDRVIDAALADIDRTPQRRALRVPWRFTHMPALSRATGIAAVALVAIVGAGGITYFAAGGPGPTATLPPTPTPAPTPGGPGIESFTSYTSAAYGITFGYPDGWRLGEAAERKWQPGDLTDGYKDWFGNPKERDGDDIVFMVWQQSAGSSDDITSREGLAEWLQANACEGVTSGGCETAPDVAIPMCAGRTSCGTAILVPLPEDTLAAIANADTRIVTIVSLLRHDAFPAAARYGGGIQLLKSILTTMDVWTPEPGQISG